MEKKGKKNLKSLYQDMVDFILIWYLKKVVEKHLLEPGMILKDSHQYKIDSYSILWQRKFYFSSLTLQDY